MYDGLEWSGTIDGRFAPFCVGLWLTATAHDRRHFQRDVSRAWWSSDITHTLDSGLENVCVWFMFMFVHFTLTRVCVFPPATKTESQTSRAQECTPLQSPAWNSGICEEETPHSPPPPPDGTGTRKESRNRSNLTPRQTQTNPFSTLYWQYHSEITSVLCDWLKFDSLDDTAGEFQWFF